MGSAGSPFGSAGSPFGSFGLIRLISVAIGLIRLIWAHSAHLRRHSAHFGFHTGSILRCNFESRVCFQGRSWVLSSRRCCQLGSQCRHLPPSLEVPPMPKSPQSTRSHSSREVSQQPRAHNTQQGEVSRYTRGSSPRYTRGTTPRYTRSHSSPQYTRSHSSPRYTRGSTPQSTAAESSLNPTIHRSLNPTIHRSRSQRLTVNYLSGTLLPETDTSRVPGLERPSKAESRR